MTRYITLFATALAFFVVLLGAFTRLTDAGLGCPDWPQCYGHMVLPSEHAALITAQSAYPEIPIESQKAWTEMIHRYIAGTLVLLVALISLTLLQQRARTHKGPWLLPIGLFALLGLQAALGMWTVTLKLWPIVVMGHLLGGMLIIGSLVYLSWSLSGVKTYTLGKLRVAIIVMTLLVFCQIALGGLVSANYAGIACIGFPKCNGLWLPQLQWSEAFNIFTTYGLNNQGGMLEPAARATLQVVHRIGALLVFCMVICVVAALWRRKARLLRAFALGLLFSVVLQCVIGIINVVYLLPLWAAVLHNAGAVVVFILCLSLIYISGASDADLP